MKISHAEVVLTKVPTKRPHRMSFATTRFQNSVHLWLYTDEGLYGLGETAHMAGFSGKGESQSSVALQLRERLLPAVLGKDPFQIEARQADLEKAIPWNPRAKSYTGVRGLMMLTLSTAKQVGVKNRSYSI